MRILYMSVHSILEFDEIRLFRGLGYTIFPLGTYFGGKASQLFRPDLDFGDEFPHLLAEFERMGGIYNQNNPHTENRIPASFVDLFDVTVVMHEPDILHHHWQNLSRRPVIWRTIGVSITVTESRMKSLRDQGMHIVRYSPIEQACPEYLGHDAIIRFSKRLSDFLPWSGEGRFALTFSNNFAQRFPIEYKLYSAATRDIKAVLGGRGNDETAHAIGLVTYAEQLELLSKASSYFYAAGTFISYTLNFMEAWLSGVPLVTFDCRMLYNKETCRYSEVPSLVTDSQDGFIVGDATGARDILIELANNPDLAHKIGMAGAKKAASLFDEKVNATAWSDLLDRITQ